MKKGIFTFLTSLLALSCAFSACGKGGSDTSEQSENSIGQPSYESELPETSETPEVSEPEASEEPETSETPEVSEEPETSETPEVSEEPETSETPEVSEEPETSEEPEPPVSEEPDVPPTSEEPEPPVEEKDPADYVDFLVDVESGREIRVLQLSDVQTIDASQKRTPGRISDSSKPDTFNGYEKYIGQVVESYQPDLIIVTGDNTYGEFDDSGESLLNWIEFMDSFQIPWAPVFGNHDNESNMGVDWQCDQFEASEYCLFMQRELTGNGNYSVGLTQGGELKRVFYMLDSNGCGGASKISMANGHTKKEVGFGQDQINWYTQSMQNLTEAYPEAKISMAFHIQLSAFEDAMRQYGYDSSTIKNSPIDLDQNELAQSVGDFGYIGAAAKNPWDTSKVVWNGIKKLGVDSIFVGHEHNNSASIQYEGVRLTYAQKSSTYDRYNTKDGLPVMGGTYINLSEEDGSISDVGLYLYDHEKGYKNPNAGADKITMDTIPEGATVLDYDFNDTDFDLTVTTADIKTMTVTKITDTTSVPTGFTGDVYGKTTDNFASVGIKFNETVNANRLLAVFVRMYVSEYSSTKTPLLRIYDDTTNNILVEKSAEDLGVTFGEWAYVDILDLMKGANMIAEDGSLKSFTLVYRFYGAEAGTVYFDSLTVVSDGNPFELDPPKEEIEGAEEYFGELCYQYVGNQFEGFAGEWTGKTNKLVKVNDENYSIAFDLTPSNFVAAMIIYLDTTEDAPTKGTSVMLTPTGFMINGTSSTYSWKTGRTYSVEIGYVELYNGNTAYVFVKVNGKVVAWQLVETYDKPDGNCIAFHSNVDKNSFIVG